MDTKYKTQLFSWLEKKWPVNKRQCEICSASNWTISDDLITPAIFSDGSISLGNSYPQAMVVCTNCGNTKYFNAVVCGIIKGKENGN